ncbi:hypothetical protein WAI453_007387 [Rhynchosporium graminicola]
MISVTGTLAIRVSTNVENVASTEAVGARPANPTASMGLVEHANHSAPHAVKEANAARELAITVLSPAFSTGSDTVMMDGVVRPNKRNFGQIPTSAGDGN